MLKNLHSKKGIQNILGLVFGIIFGIFLQKGGATQYEIIVNQLLLTDFTVVKIMMSAVVTGMIGIHVLKSLGMAEFNPKAGSVGMNVIGGLVFGVAFATLGYCPGTAFGAVGNGYLDALVGGVFGMLVGSSLFAAVYPKINDSILKKGYFGELTFPGLLKMNRWVVVIIFAILIIGILYLLEHFGL
jgi:hypothetical protein